MDIRLRELLNRLRRRARDNPAQPTSELVRQQTAEVQNEETLVVRVTSYQQNKHRPPGTLTGVINQ